MTPPGMSVTLPKFWSYLYRVGQEKHYSLGPEEEINQTLECPKHIHGYGQAVPPWNIHILSGCRYCLLPIPGSQWDMNEIVDKKG